MTVPTFRLRWLALWASAGAWIGAASALLTALGDFGALWLWLPLWTDRGWLLLGLLGTQVPLGALAGYVLGALAYVLVRLADMLAERFCSDDEAGARRARARLLATLCAVMMAPGMTWLALMLFTGGKMSKLPYRTWMEVMTAGALVCACWSAALLALRVSNLAKQIASAGATCLVLLGLAAAFLIGKIDQHVLPTHYGYLHAVLSILSWALAGYGFTVVATRVAMTPRLKTGVSAIGLLLTVGMSALLFFGWSSLDTPQNVRVAMMSPRASHSRSLMLGLQELLPQPGRELQTARRAKAPRAERRPRRLKLTANGLPAAPDAHVMLISIDALRADHLGTYGYHRPTSPHLDRLSEDSVTFERAYVQAPHSSYSVSSLMTSEYLHETVDLGQPLPQKTLATVMNAAGYRTAAFYTSGLFHTAAERFKQYEKSAFGFALHDHSNLPAEQMTDRVLEELDRTVALGEPKSLFWVHYFDVHEPYRATSFGTSDVDRYDSEIRQADRAIGRLVAEARRRLTRDLVVVVTADHGEEFREHGGVYHGSTLYEEQVRVPLMLHVPNLKPRRVAAPVELIDVAPTLLSLVGVASPPSMRGDDLRGLLMGKGDDWGPVFSAVSQKRMVVQWPYKLIADLRYRLYELYDLAADPSERHNLADEKRSLMEALRTEVYAWLDSLSHDADPDADELAPDEARAVAMHRGRLGDGRAVEPLAALVADRTAPAAQRSKAARILGKLGDPRAAKSLVLAMQDDDHSIAAEAAIALGRMYDPRARQALRRLVSAEDPDIRCRAAVSLARLRDRDAVPGLIDTLWVTSDKYERDEAVRWLGRLRDSRGLEPLVSMLPELRTRYLVTIALGQLGDPRAYEPLADVLSWERHPNVRDNAVRGLGLLGDRRALELILPLATLEPGLRNTSESLVRLDALAEQAIGGADVQPGKRGLRGFAECSAGPELHDWNYLHRTWCETRRGVGSVQLQVPEAVADAPNGAVAVLAARRTDAANPSEMRIWIGQTQLEPVQVDGKWNEYRWPIPPNTLAKGSMKARFRGADEQARFALDHLLLVPQIEPMQTGHGG